MIRTALLIATLCAAFAVPSAAQGAPAPLVSFLRETVRLNGGEIAAVEKGEPVVKSLDTQNREDVAVFGIVTLDAGRNAYLARVADHRTFLRVPNRTAFGLFSQPPGAADVATVVIDSQDVEDLKRCKPSDCKLKLPAAVMGEAREVAGAADRNQARAETNAYARRRLVEYVADYQSRGDAAMVVYDDRGNTRASDAFDGLLAQSPYVYQYVPSLHQYLQSYPKGALPGATDVIYWSVDEMPGLRPILNVNHLVVYSPPELPGTALLATKQIFANHYFEALFDLTTVIDRPGGGGSYLISIRRFRFDRMPRIGMVSLKGKVIGKLKDQLADDLRNEQKISRN